MLKAGDKVGIVACSNPLRKESREAIEKLDQTLQAMGLVPVFGDYIYAGDGESAETPLGAASGQERARVLMDCYRDEEIKAIFDISGGDLANGVLPHLDFEEIARSNKLFWGYSDLTTLVNAIYKMTGKPSVLYQIRNIISEESGGQQVADFRSTVMKTEGQQTSGDDLFQFDYDFVQGNALRGEVVGGNIRCFLKLAGTPYLPDLTDKILLLEARSGLEAQIETYMAQLSQMGAFEKVSGVLLGTFTKLESIKGMPRPEEILKKYVRADLPIAVTRNIGHAADSKAIRIGKELGRSN